MNKSTVLVFDTFVMLLMHAMTLGSASAHQSKSSHSFLTLNTTPVVNKCTSAYRMLLRIIYLWGIPEMPVYPPLCGL